MASRHGSSRTDHSHHRAECRGRKGPQGLRSRPGPLRRDAPRLLRRHRPPGRHGSRRGPRTDVLPVVSRASPAARCSPRRTRSSQPPVSWPGTTSSSTSGAQPHRIGSSRWSWSPSGTWRPRWPRCERTAAKGAKSITFTEAPHRLGLPSFHSDHWDPFLAAAQAADMPLCLHFGSGGAPVAAPDANFAVAIALFGMNSQFDHRRPAATRRCSTSSPACALHCPRAVSGGYPTCSSGSTTPGSGTAGTPASTPTCDRRICSATTSSAASSPTTPGIEEREPHRRRQHHVRGRLPPQRQQLPRVAGRSWPTCSPTCPTTKPARSPRTTRDESSTSPRTASVRR